MKLTFHKRIYAPAAVEAAVQAFDGVAKITVTAKGDYFEVELEAAEPGSQAEVAAEFDNYVLGETIALRGAA